MSLSEIMSGAGLTLWPILAMALFLGVFAAVLVRVFRRSRAEHERHARLPLDDASVTRGGSHG